MAHAVELLRTLKVKDRYALDDEDYSISLGCQFGNYAQVDEHGLERLRVAIRQHGLNIEIVETT